MFTENSLSACKSRQNPGHWALELRHIWPRIDRAQSRRRRCVSYGFPLAGFACGGGARAARVPVRPRSRRTGEGRGITKARVGNPQPGDSLWRTCRALGRELVVEEGIPGAADPVPCREGAGEAALRWARASVFTGRPCDWDRGFPASSWLTGVTGDVRVVLGWGEARRRGGLLERVRVLGARGASLACPAGPLVWWARLIAS